MPDHKQEPLVRSSAAEYLTFVAATGDSTESMEMRYEDENIWLTQKMMAALYDVSVSAINQHLKTIFEDGELEKDSVIKKYLITAADGKSYLTTTTCKPPLLWALRSTMIGRSSFANGQMASSRITPSRAGLWTATG